MGCTASNSHLVLRRDPEQCVTPSKTNTYLRFFNHQKIEETINGDQNKTNGNRHGRTGDGQEKSPNNQTEPHSISLDTNKSRAKDLDNITHQSDGHQKNLSEDPILKRLLDELQSVRRRSTTGRTMNRMKKLQSKIDRYKLRKPLERNSKARKQNPGRKGLLGSLLEGSITSALNLDFLVNEVLSGNVASVCPSNAKIVRIFTSSTFTDTKHERNYLMENVYPKLKVFCQQRGYQFQIVDMRWGIRDEATNDHMTTDLCLKELELCQELSTGPNFVSFLSHKYGYRPCPRTISKEQFEKFLQATKDPDDRSLMLRWYIEDKNTLKSLYILQPVGDILIDILSVDPKKKQKAKDQWWEESERLRDIISSLAKRLLSKEEARLFLMSVTEIEITKGILNVDDVEDHCLWFKRNILNIENQKYDNYVKKFRECPKVSKEFKESQQLLQNLKEERMSQKLPKDNILSYDIRWSPQGVDPEANEEHRQYLVELGRDFQQQLQNLIEKGIAQKGRKVLNDPLYEEVKQHTLFCQKKCESFSGRDDTLKKIQDYVQGKKTDPLVIYGKSGCGKTSLMAKAAINISQWTNGEAAVILRFIGTTLSSSDANSLMVSIIHQIQYIFSCPQPISANNEELERQFHESLKKGSKEKPLVVILDSLDQLSAISGGRQLAWLMKEDSLPKHTKVILSTLPEKQYVCFPQLQSWIKDESQFLEVPRLPLEDVGTILSQWFQRMGQTLTDKQRDIVLQAFNKCPLPLFLKLSFDVARGWHSYSPDSATVLEHTVRDSIKSLFNRTEVKHGKILVSHALGYLTLAGNGLSELELEDILSCDEKVLNDVYMYWTPPIRRLPPLLLVRIKNDLEEYLVNRGSDGVQVIDWYHRQFIETATEIYCSDPDTNELLYSGLVDYFSGKWSNGIPKPFIDKTGTPGECDRLVTQQPIRFENEPNLRKLNNLPHLLVKAKMVKRLKEEVVFNHEFLLTKMKATSVREVLDDFLLACETFPQDEAILTVTEALQLSQDALSYDPDQLPAQLIGRLPDISELQPFIESCRNSELPYLEADHNVLVRPGGQLLHCIPAHKGEIASFDISSDKMTAVTLCMKEGCIKFWDTLKGQQISEFGGFDDKSDKVQFCDDDRFVAINPDYRIIFISTETASLAHSLDMKSLVGDRRMENPFFQVCGRKKSWVMFHNTFHLLICDIKSSEKKYSINLAEEEAYVIDPSIPAAGSDQFVALSLSTEPSKILAVNLQTGSVQRLDVGQFFSESDSYPNAIALCPKSGILYFSGVENEDLFCYDLLNGKLVKILQGTKQIICENFRISADGQFIHYITEETVKVWDLHLEENKTVLAVNGMRVLDAGIVSETIVMTTFPDGNLRIWNHARTFKDTGTKVTFDQVNHGSVREVKFLPNPRYLLFMIGFGPFYWYVYDVTTCEVLMELQLTGSKPTVFPIGNTQIGVVSQTHKLKVMDLETCLITTVFQGRVNPESCFLTIKNDKEILTTSKGRRNLKVYKTETGRTVKIIQGICQYISHISINKSETIAVAFTEEDCVLIVDILQYKILQVLNSNIINCCHGILVNQETVQVSHDGTLLILMVKKYLDSNKNDSIFCTLLWNIKQEKVECQMFDHEYHERYKEEIFAETNADVESATFMQDDQVVLSTHDDYIIRVFSTASGELQKRITQHFNVPTLLLSPNENLPYFVSWVGSDEEIAFCLWRKETFEKVATFKLDEMPKIVALSPSGDVVIGRGKTEDHPITLWKLKNGINDPRVFSQMKEINIFKKHGFGNRIKMSEKDDDKTDESDPDDDDDDDVGDEDYNDGDDDDFKPGSDLESLCDMYKKFIY